MRSIVIALLLAGSATAAAAEGAYHVYYNARFGVSADIPSGWKAGPEPEINDGLVFTSPEGAATITVSGILNVDSSAAQAIADEQKGRDGETVTYRSKSARQAVISGTRGDMIFYRKLIISCKDQILNHLEIEYPAAQKQAFDGLVAHVAGSLHSGPSWQISSCK
jgi:serine/threonine-protein kinase